MEKARREHAVVLYDNKLTSKDIHQKMIVVIPDITKE